MRSLHSVIPSRSDEWMLVFILVFFVLVYTTSVSLSMLRTSWDSACGARIFFLSVYSAMSHIAFLYTLLCQYILSMHFLLFKDLHKSISLRLVISCSLTLLILPIILLSSKCFSLSWSKSMSRVVPQTWTHRLPF